METVAAEKTHHSWVKAQSCQVVISSGCSHHGKRHGDAQLVLPHAMTECFDHQKQTTIMFDGSFFGHWRSIRADKHYGTAVKPRWHQRLATTENMIKDVFVKSHLSPETVEWMREWTARTEV